MNQHKGSDRPSGERELDGAEGGMGDGGDPAGAQEAGIHPALEKELTEGGLGQALAGVTGQPGLAGAEERTSKATDEAKAQAGSESPAKE